MMQSKLMKDKSQVVAKICFVALKTAARKSDYVSSMILSGHCSSQIIVWKILKTTVSIHGGLFPRVV